MTSLLNKTSIYYILFSFVVFATGSILFFFVLKSILDKEVTENLYLEKARIEDALQQSQDIKTLNLFYDYRMSIQPVANNEEFATTVKDTNVYDALEEEILPYRQIRFLAISNGKPLLVTYRISLIEEHDLREGILMAMLPLFAAFILSMFFLNRWMSKRLWKPFYSTLDRMKTFEINHKEGLAFETTAIKEFAQLNDTLTSMSERILSDYRSMKEFTENASHEIQTPLSIITNQLENFIQSEKLDAKQFQSIQVVYESALRLSRLNSSLILLTRIDNNQYIKTEELHLAAILSKYLALYDDLLRAKNIHVHTHVDNKKTVRMNAALAEILVANLLMNAIRHNIKDGEITIQLVDHQLTISNTGAPFIGDPDDLFKRFKKADPSSDSLGLGLAIIKRITDYSGFTIRYIFAGNRHTLSAKF